MESIDSTFSGIRDIWNRMIQCQPPACKEDLYLSVYDQRNIYIYTYETKKDYVTESDSHNDRWSLDRIFTRGFLSHA